MFGGHRELVPRFPIPNRIVKRLIADDSMDYPCESRTPPNSLYPKPLSMRTGVFVSYDEFQAETFIKLASVADLFVGLTLEIVAFLIVMSSI